MSSRPNDYSPADWVEYTRSSDDPYWSSGRRFEATDISLNNYYISTSSNVVNVNFQSDSAYEERGFWLAFKGYRRALYGLLVEYNNFIEFA